MSKRFLGIATERQVPKIANQSFYKWYLRHKKPSEKKMFKSAVYLFNDEFTNFYDVNVGKDAVILLETLGYEVKIIKHA